MPERSLLKLLPAAVCLVIFLAVLLIARSFFRRATRGETVQATVRRVEMDGSIPDIHPDVTILYVFPWQGRILERPVGPRKNILPPPIGQRQNMRYDAKSDRLREVPTGRPTSCLTLLYGVAPVSYTHLSRSREHFSQTASSSSCDISGRRCRQSSSHT